MLNFYNAKILLDYDLIDDGGEYWIGTSQMCDDTDYLAGVYEHSKVNLIKEPIKAEQLMSGEMHTLCLSINELICFIMDWHNHAKYKSETLLNDWIWDYFKCYVAAYEAETKEEIFKTYQDTMGYVVINNYVKRFEDPTYAHGVWLNTPHLVDFDGTESLEPEFSFKVEDVLRNRESKWYADVESKVLENGHILTHNISKLNAMSFIVGDRLMAFDFGLTNNTLDDILNGKDNGCNPLYYFQNPFTATDFETNYVHIAKCLRKYNVD